MLKNGFLTLLFAFIPGAGQMYQGYMKRGLSLILMCCAIGAVAARRRPSATMSSVVSAVDSAETGMSLQISQILAM